MDALWKLPNALRFCCGAAAAPAAASAG